MSGSTLSNPSWPLIVVVLWQNQQLVQQLGLQEVLNPVAAVVFSFNNCRPATLQHASTKGQVKPRESAQTISNHSQILTYNYSISLSLTVFFKYKECWPISKANRFRLHSMQKKKCTVHPYSAAPDVTQFLELEDIPIISEDSPKTFQAFLIVSVPSKAWTTLCIAWIIARMPARTSLPLGISRSKKSISRGHQVHQVHHVLRLNTPLRPLLWCRSCSTSPKPGTMAVSNQSLATDA